MTNESEFRRVGDLIDEGHINRTELLKSARSGKLSLAIYADGFFVWPAVKLPNNQYDVIGPCRLCENEWLYVSEKYLRRLESPEPVVMGLMRSSRESATDTLVRLAGDLRSQAKPKTTLENLFISSDCLESVPTENSFARNEQSTTYVFRRIAAKKWEFGEPGATKTLPARKGFWDISLALKTPNQDIQPSVFFGHDPGEAPTFSDEDALSKYTIDKLQRNLADIKESIRIAKEEGKDNLAEKYEEEETKIRSYLDKNTRPDGRSRKLSGGNTNKQMTNVLKNRFRTVISNLEKAHLHKLASHLKAHYSISDLSVAYTNPDKSVKWTLD